MDHYAVLGNPIEHSRSPYIHARFAAATGQALDYARLFCPLDGFDTVVRTFAAGGARGLNVTVPFKFEAARIAARLTPRAALAEAVNTLRFDSAADGGWLGDNTDGVGVVRDIQRNGGVPLAGARVLLVGAGGGAAGALGGLLEAGPAEVVVANRSVDKAQGLVRRHAALADTHHCALKSARLDDCGRGYDIVINATAASLKGAGVPVAAAVLGNGALAVDMMYGAAARPFLDWARAHGAHGRDGLGMLVEQAAEAFALWRGVMPDTGAVLADLRRQVDAPAP